MASQPDDELVKDIFAHHGLAVYLAHVLERSLVTALTSVYGPGRTRLTERQLEERTVHLLPPDCVLTGGLVTSIGSPFRGDWI